MPDDPNFGRPKPMSFRSDYLLHQKDLDALEAATPPPDDVRVQDGEDYYSDVAPLEEVREEELMRPEEIDPAMIEELVRKQNAALYKPRKYAKVFMCTKCGTPTISEGIYMKLVSFRPKEGSALETRQRTIGYLCTACVVNDVDYRRPPRRGTQGTGPVGLKAFDEAPE